MASSTSVAVASETTPTSDPSAGHVTVRVPPSEAARQAPSI